MQWFKRYAVCFSMGSDLEWHIVKWANEYNPYFAYDSPYTLFAFALLRVIVMLFSFPFLFSFSQLTTSSREQFEYFSGKTWHEETATYDNLKFYLVVIQLETNSIAFHAGLTFICFTFQHFRFSPFLFSPSYDPIISAWRKNKKIHDNH